MIPIGTIGQRLRRAVRLLPRARYRRALLRGVGAGDQHEPVLRLLAPSLIVDVGANRGQFLLAALEACPGARIHAVEPQPAALARLRSWLDREPAADRARVVLHQVALADRIGMATLHVAARDDNSSLLEPTEAQLALFPGTGIAGSLTVPLTRLDSLLTAAEIGPTALLKIDVQGAEDSVLAGAGALLSRFRWVYVECSTRELYRGQRTWDAVAARLAGAGFVHAGDNNPVRDAAGVLVQADRLFARTGA